MYKDGTILHVKNEIVEIDAVAVVYDCRVSDGWINYTLFRLSGKLYGSGTLTYWDEYFDSVTNVTNYYDAPLYKLLTGRQ